MPKRITITVDVDDEFVDDGGLIEDAHADITDALMEYGQDVRITVTE